MVYVSILSLICYPKLYIYIFLGYQGKAKLTNGFNPLNLLKFACFESKSQTLTIVVQTFVLVLIKR